MCVCVNEWQTIINSNLYKLFYITIKCLEKERETKTMKVYRIIIVAHVAARQTVSQKISQFCVCDKVINHVNLID